MRVANIEALSPTVTDWKHGQELVASSWSSVDSISSIDGAKIRTIKHYSTEMIEFVDQFDGTWWFGPLSYGMASNSDMKGFGKLADTVGSPFRIRRTKGEGRVINVDLGVKVATRDNGF